MTGLAKGDDTTMAMQLVHCSNNHAIEDLLQQGRLARRGQKYPTVWLPNKPVRAPASPRVVSEATNSRSKPSRGRRFSDLIRAVPQRILSAATLR